MPLTSSQQVNNACFVSCCELLLPLLCDDVHLQAVSVFICNKVDSSGLALVSHVIKLHEYKGVVGFTTGSEAQCGWDLMLHLG